MTQVASDGTWTAIGHNRREAAMAMDITSHNERQASFDRKPSLEYYLIFAASFVIFLVAAVIERLMPWTWLNTSRDRARPSLFARALDAAKTCTAYAFMG